METIKFKVVGTSPLLTHNPAGMGMTNDNLGTKKSQIPSPDVEAKNGLYVTDEGRSGIPAAAFRGSLVGAAKGRKFGKVFATSAVKGGVFVEDTLCTLCDPETGLPLDDYIIDMRRVKVGTGSNAPSITRCRPKFPAWATTIAFEIDEDLMDKDKVRSLLEIGGRSICVGD